MYLQFYDLINHFIFSDVAQDVAHTDLVCTILATIGVVVLVAIPFVLVFKVINFIIGA